MRQALVGIGCCVLVLWAAGCTHSATPVVLPSGSLEQTLDPNEVYTISVADIMSIKFYYYPELDVNVTVRPDGRITLPLIGDVMVAGRTPEAVDHHLTETFASHLDDPEVAVIIQACAGFRVYVGGEVHTPRSVPYRGGLTALQAVMEAGGFKSTAHFRNVVLLRDQGSAEAKFEVLNLHLDGISDAQQRDVRLQPKDILFVPKTQIAKMNQFVKEYFRDLMPVVVGFNVGYNLNPVVEFE